ncbi:MAG: UDP-N-acetylglucosamine 2-epimerase [Planctomycetota bacterium]
MTTDAPASTSDGRQRRVCVVLVDRANYGRLKPVMVAIREHVALELQVLAAGTMVLERFNRPVDVVRRDGFTVHGEAFIELEGSTPESMAKSVGLGVIEFATFLRHLAPDIVLIIGDRYEALSATIAAAYMNLPIVHVQGGEVSGSIDESARHAITKFAQFHVPATQLARQRLLLMGERPESILTVGCPSSDLARTLDPPPSGLTAEVLAPGSGADIDPAQPFLLVVFHPVTTAYNVEAVQVHELLAALDQLRMPTLMLWPNIDAGSDHVSKEIRRFRTRSGVNSWLRLMINIAPDDYLRVLGGTACAVGNSSSFVRDAGYFGTPVVLVGDRQDGRETDHNVVRVPVDSAAIADATRVAIRRGRHPASALYGDGHVAGRVVDALAALAPYVQKRFCDGAAHQHGSS